MSLPYAPAFNNSLVELPDAITTDIDLNEMELNIEVPLLNVETELEE